MSYAGSLALEYSREESGLENVKKTNDEGAQIIQAEGKTKAEQRKKATVEKAEAKQDEKKAKTEHEEAS